MLKLDFVQFLRSIPCEIGAIIVFLFSLRGRKLLASNKNTNSTPISLGNRLAKIVQSRVKRKRSFVLTEVLIAVSLFSMLLVVMFGIFLRCARVNEVITKQRHFYEKLLVAQSRLQTIISKSHFKISKENPSYFYIEQAKDSRGQSLVFKYENDVELSSEFLLALGSKIYVDENDCLCVASWLHEDPIKEVPEKVRKEILLEKIASLEVELFAPSLIKTKEPKNEEMQIPRTSWVTSWPKEANMRPALVKLIATRCEKDKEPLVFWFMIPKEIQTIIYRTK